MRDFSLQLPRFSTWERLSPLFNIAEDEADLEEWALYTEVSMSAPDMALSIYLARVEGVTV